MLEDLTCSLALPIVVDKQLCYYFGSLRARIRNQFRNSCPFLLLEIELHMRCHSTSHIKINLGQNEKYIINGDDLLLEFGKEFFSGRAQYIMDLMNLVELVVAGEEGKEGKNFEEYTANPPMVHLVIVIAVGEQTFWRSVPPRRNILGEGRLRIHAPTRTKISQLHLIVLNQDILSSKFKLFRLD